jgi:hypothetical protein
MNTIIILQSQNWVLKENLSVALFAKFKTCTRCFSQMALLNSEPLSFLTKRKLKNEHPLTDTKTKGTLYPHLCS